MIPWLDKDTPFPPVNAALSEDAPGLLAAGADLSSARLLQAYRLGIFPWFSEGQPVLWWSTDPRMVLPVKQFKLSKSLQKTLRKLQKNPAIAFKFDTAFESVVRACAAPRRDGAGTWISEPMISAYTELHCLGYAHSVEMWQDDQLVGGAYGLCIGRMFFGESMFARVTDASKMALAHLVHFLKTQEVELIDCQQETGHLASLGAAPIARSEFVRLVAQAVLLPPITDWKINGTGI